MKKKYGEKYLQAKARLDGKILENESKISEEKPKPPKEILETPDIKSVKTPKEKTKISENLKVDESSNSSETSDDDDDVYTCEVCKKVCTGFITYKLHLEGKKHLKNVQKIALMKKLREDKLIPEVEAQPKEGSFLDKLIPQTQLSFANMECKVCKKKCVGPEAFKQHCKSASHQKKLAMEDLLQNMEKEGLSPSKGDDETYFAHCDICMKGFSGPLPYMQHMESLAHFKQERHLEQMNKIKDLVISKEESSKFKCKECGKMFSGPVPFNAHLKSAIHGKTEKKNALLNSLQKKHPEMIKTIVGDNSDDSDEDDNVMLGCKVCHMVFTGPEVAKDHFSSSKHKKALKKKAQFKKFKQQQKAVKLLDISGGKKMSKQSNSDVSSDFEDEFDIITES
ncbi:c2H2-type domain-containing protein [Trichonephila inaurata madagascariensis]|uniref:C2H2-type domain-containing protein n=1 Tax=Trichonephila inaurata madagascariensis TaxID=2747483 RepID=A0A8X7C912_9ARAC|nr:c2H2-type domain-containing protein [Trichonephila inaurata madagascariensis]